MKVEAEIATAEGKLARVSTGRAWALSAGSPVAAFDAAPLMLRRAMVGGLVEVKLHPAPRGRKTFDPRSVGVRWLPL